MSRYADDEILNLIDHAGADGDELDLLYSALWYSTGSSGPERLREVAVAGGSAHLRALAIGALAWRVGASANATYLEALGDDSLEVQRQAAIALAEHGDAAAWPAFSAWLGRRFARSRDSMVWDPVELPCAARFADRLGLDLDLRSFVAAHWGNLVVDERARVIAVAANSLHSAAGNTDFSEVDVHALGEADVFGRPMGGQDVDEDTDPMLGPIERTLERLRARMTGEG